MWAPGHVWLSASQLSFPFTWDSEYQVLTGALPLTHLWTAAFACVQVSSAAGKVSTLQWIFLGSAQSKMEWGIHNDLFALCLFSGAFQSAATWEHSIWITEIYLPIHSLLVTEFSYKSLILIPSEVMTSDQIMYCNNAFLQTRWCSITKVKLWVNFFQFSEFIRDGE